MDGWLPTPMSEVARCAADRSRSGPAQPRPATAPQIIQHRPHHRVRGAQQRALGSGRRHDTAQASAYAVQFRFPATAAATARARTAHRPVQPFGVQQIDRVEEHPGRAARRPAPHDRPLRRGAADRRRIGRSRPALAVHCLVRRVGRRRWRRQVAGDRRRDPLGAWAAIPARRRISSISSRVGAVAPIFSANAATHSSPVIPSLLSPPAGARNPAPEASFLHFPPIVRTPVHPGGCRFSPRSGRAPETGRRRS